MEFLHQNCFIPATSIPLPVYHSGRMRGISHGTKRRKPVRMNPSTACGGPPPFDKGGFFYQSVILNEVKDLPRIGKRNATGNTEQMWM